MMPYCTSYFKFLFKWFLGVPEQNKDFDLQNLGERGYHFVSIAHSISSILFDFFFLVYACINVGNKLKVFVQFTCIRIKYYTI